jgi:hypothetical protein
MEENHQAFHISKMFIKKSVSNPYPSFLYPTKLLPATGAGHKNV